MKETRSFLVTIIVLVLAVFLSGQIFGQEINKLPPAQNPAVKVVVPTELKVERDISKYIATKIEPKFPGTNGDKPYKSVFIQFYRGEKDSKSRPQILFFNGSSESDLTQENWEMVLRVLIDTAKEIADKKGKNVDREKSFGHKFVLQVGMPTVVVNKAVQQPVSIKGGTPLYDGILESNGIPYKGVVELRDQGEREERHPANTCIAQWVWDPGRMYWRSQIKALNGFDLQTLTSEEIKKAVTYLRENFPNKWPDSSTDWESYAFAIIKPKASMSSRFVVGVRQPLVILVLPGETLPAQATVVQPTVPATPPSTSPNQSSKKEDNVNQSQVAANEAANQIADLQKQINALKAADEGKRFAATIAALQKENDELKAAKGKQADAQTAATIANLQRQIDELKANSAQQSAQASVVTSPPPKALQPPPVKMAPPDKPKEKVLPPIIAGTPKETAPAAKPVKPLTLKEQVAKLEKNLATANKNLESAKDDTKKAVAEKNTANDQKDAAVGRANTAEEALKKAKMPFWKNPAFIITALLALLFFVLWVLSLKKNGELANQVVKNDSVLAENEALKEKLSKAELETKEVRTALERTKAAKKPKTKAEKIAENISATSKELAKEVDDLFEVEGKYPPPLKENESFSESEAEKQL